MLFPGVKKSERKFGRIIFWEEVLGWIDLYKSGDRRRRNYKQKEEIGSREKNKVKGHPGKGLRKRILQRCC